VALWMQEGMAPRLGVVPSQEVRCQNQQSDYGHRRGPVGEFWNRTGPVA